MSPRLALKILLSLSFIFVVSLFVFYQVKQELYKTSLNESEYQAEMEKRALEVEALLGGVVNKKSLQEEKDRLISDDLKIYNKVRPETIQIITDLDNIEIRRKKGLPPNSK